MKVCKPRSRSAKAMPSYIIPHRRMVRRRAERSHRWNDATNVEGHSPRFTGLRTAVGDLLSRSPEVGAGRAIFGRLKAILARSETIIERTFRDLQELGLEVVSENTHYRITFRGNEFYKFTLPKTPSDYREGRNSLSNITMRLSIYK